MPGAVIGLVVGVTRAVIGGCVIGGLRMIMLVPGRRWFGEWIADVFWNRLAGTVVSAVPYPAGQLRYRGSGWVIDDGGRLRHRVRLDAEHSRTAGQHRLRHVL
jgi:hypothetical protein